MHKNGTKCNETLSKWCKNKNGASKIIDTFETYQDLPKSSPPSKKDTVEPDLILVSSSGEPSGSKRHVSPKILAL
jgi:hypothetical protein